VSALKVWYLRQMATWSTFFRQSAMALEYWERIRVMRPRDPAVLATVAGLHASAGRRDHARELLRESIGIDAAQAYVHFNLGYLLQQDDHHAEALDAFERALALNPKLDQALYGQALSLIKLDRVEEALEPLKANVRLQPLSPYGFYQLAHALNRLGRHDEARKVIVQLSGFEPQVARQVQRETGIDAGLPE
jgi:tetratricopeptide (TPR) repeat protein